MRDIVQYATYNDVKNNQLSPFNRIKRSGFMGSYYAVETIKGHTHDEQSAAEESGEQDGHGDGAVPEGTPEECIHHAPSLNTSQNLQTKISQLSYL